MREMKMYVVETGVGDCRGGNAVEGGHMAPSKSGVNKLTKVSLNVRVRRLLGAPKG